VAKTVLEILQDIITISARVERLAGEVDRMDERQDTMNERLIRIETQIEMAMRAPSAKRIRYE
jgi:hypothetical protein